MVVYVSDGYGDIRIAVFGQDKNSEATETPRHNEEADAAIGGASMRVVHVSRLTNPHDVVVLILHSMDAISSFGRLFTRMLRDLERAIPFC
jgi:hypothetical protein